MSTQAKLHTFRQELAVHHIERHDEVHITLAALLAREHIALIGPPGTAKSMLAQSICSSITGANMFEWLFGKFTTPEEFLGPLSIKGLKDDRYRRVTSGKAPEAHIVFADEIFKSNSAALNEWLPIMNERVFYQEGRAEPVPLLMLIGASNELPTDKEELSALWDRFLFRKIVSYIHEDSNFIRMLQMDEKFNPSATLSLDEIVKAQEETDAVEIGQDIDELLTSIRTEMNMDGMVVSDRRYKKSRRVLQASAYLAGRAHVDPDDFSILKHLLWENPAHAREVERLILNRTNPTEREALELIEMAGEIQQEMRESVRAAKAQGGEAEAKLSRQGVEWFQKAKKLGKSVKDLENRVKASGKTVAKVDEAKYFIVQVMKSVAQEALGMDVSALEDMNA
ncbi:MAG: ATPase [Tenericutes bacterium]|nr:MAG: ATPase [Mycoplasmatota bacterium]